MGKIPFRIGGPTERWIKKEEGEPEEWGYQKRGNGRIDEKKRKETKEKYFPYKNGEIVKAKQKKQKSS